MADVSQLVGRWKGARERGDRAQLFLVGALALAVIFIALALLLNSAIYTENLSARNVDAGAEGVIGFTQDAVAGTGAAMANANSGADTEFEGVQSTYEDNLGAWIDSQSRYASMQGATTNVTPEANREGAVVANTNETSDLTNRTGSKNWTVAVDVKPRNLMVVVDADSLKPGPIDLSDLSTGNTTFTMQINDGTTQWRVGVFKDDANTTVQVYGDTDTRSCSVERDRVAIDVFGALVGGEPCNALTMVQPEGTVDVRFYNADSDHVIGTFSMIVDRTAPVVNATVEQANGGATYYQSKADGSPFVSPAVYDANVTMTYRSSDARLTTTRRVAPNEPGAPADHPTLDDFLITDNSSGENATFSVAWDASDPNGDLANVSVELVNASGTAVDSYTGTASDSAELSDEGGEGEEYIIRFILLDEARNERQVELPRTAGGGG